VNIQKNLNYVLFFILIALINSCYKDNNANKNKETEQRISAMLMTPDSLRTAEDKILIQKIEAIYYESCSIKNDRFELAIRKKEFKKRGVPDVCYEMMKKDLDNTNNFLDTTTFIHKQMMLDSFRKSQEEYLSRRKSQSSE